MSSNESEAETYQDLMQLLPGVAKIRLWWDHDDDGVPNSIRRVALSGHDGELLIEIDTDDIHQPMGFMLETLDQTEQDLRERLPAAVMILNWLDAFELDEEDGVSVLILPSASHVGDAPPEEWI